VRPSRALVGSDPARKPPECPGARAQPALRGR